jgi:hypothetical protein
MCHYTMETTALTAFSPITDYPLQGCRTVWIINTPDGAISIDFCVARHTVVRFGLSSGMVSLDLNIWDISYMYRSRDLLHLVVIRYIWTISARPQEVTCSRHRNQISDHRTPAWHLIQRAFTSLMQVPVYTGWGGNHLTRKFILFDVKPHQCFCLINDLERNCEDYSRLLNKSSFITGPCLT